jgi:mycothiol synthase
VDPAEHGRGLGAALTVAGLRHLAGRGARMAMLYVEADNEKAIRTYQRLGFAHWDTDVCFLRSAGTATQRHEN